eukprot:gene12118-13369_t
MTGRKSKSNKHTSSYSENNPLCVGSLRLYIGAKIEALDSKKWYFAKVIKINEASEKVLIHFDGWNSRHDKWFHFESDSLRSLSSTLKSEESAKQGENLKKKVLPIERQEHSPGDRVLARWSDCKFYPATISRAVNDSSYEVIFYDGFKKMISRSNVRPDRKKTFETFEEKFRSVSSPTSPTSAEPVSSPLDEMPQSSASSSVARHKRRHAEPSTMADFVTELPVKRPRKCQFRGDAGEDDEHLQSKDSDGESAVSTPRVGRKKRYSSISSSTSTSTSPALSSSKTSPSDSQTPKNKSKTSKKVFDSSPEQEAEHASDARSRSKQEKLAGSKQMKKRKCFGSLLKVKLPMKSKGKKKNQDNEEKSSPSRGKTDSAFEEKVVNKSYRIGHYHYDDALVSDAREGVKGRQYLEHDNAKGRDDNGSEKREDDAMPKRLPKRERRLTEKGLELQQSIEFKKRYDIYSKEDIDGHAGSDVREYGEKEARYEDGESIDGSLIDNEAVHSDLNSGSEEDRGIDDKKKRCNIKSSERKFQKHGLDAKKGERKHMGESFGIRELKNIENEEQNDIRSVAEDTKGDLDEDRYSDADSEGSLVIDMGEDVKDEEPANNSFGGNECNRESGEGVEARDKGKQKTYPRLKYTLSHEERKGNRVEKLKKMKGRKAVAKNEKKEVLIEKAKKEDSNASTPLQSLTKFVTAQTEVETQEGKVDEEPGSLVSQSSVDQKSDQKPNKPAKQTRGPNKPKAKMADQFLSMVIQDRPSLIERPISKDLVNEKAGKGKAKNRLAFWSRAQNIMQAEAGQENEVKILSPSDNNEPLEFTQSHSNERVSISPQHPGLLVKNQNEANFGLTDVKMSNTKSKTRKEEQGGMEVPKGHVPPAYIQYPGPHFIAGLERRFSPIQQSAMDHRASHYHVDSQTDVPAIASSSTALESRKWSPHVAACHSEGLNAHAQVSASPYQDDSGVDVNRTSPNPPPPYPGPEQRPYECLTNVVKVEGALNTVNAKRQENDEPDIHSIRHLNKDSHEDSHKDSSTVADTATSLISVESSTASESAFAADSKPISLESQTVDSERSAAIDAQADVEKKRNRKNSSTSSTDSPSPTATKLTTFESKKKRLDFITGKLSAQKKTKVENEDLGQLNKPGIKARAEETTSPRLNAIKQDKEDADSVKSSETEDVKAISPDIALCSSQTPDIIEHRGMPLEGLIPAGQLTPHSDTRFISLAAPTVNFTAGRGVSVSQKNQILYPFPTSNYPGPFMHPHPSSGLVPMQPIVDQDGVPVSGFCPAAAPGPPPPHRMVYPPRAHPQYFQTIDNMAHVQPFGAPYGPPRHNLPPHPPPGYFHPRDSGYGIAGPVFSAYDPRMIPAGFLPMAPNVRPPMPVCKQQDCSCHLPHTSPPAAVQSKAASAPPLGAEERKVEQESMLQQEHSSTSASQTALSPKSKSEKQKASMMKGDPRRLTLPLQRLKKMAASAYSKSAANGFPRPDSRKQSDTTDLGDDEARLSMEHVMDAEFCCDAPQHECAQANSISHAAEDKGKENKPGHFIPKKIESTSKKKGKEHIFAPKEFVVELNLDEYKCSVKGCEKSFRKSSSLEYHIRYFHSPRVQQRKRNASSISLLSPDSAAGMLPSSAANSLASSLPPLLKKNRTFSAAESNDTRASNDDLASIRSGGGSLVMTDDNLSDREKPDIASSDESDETDIESNGTVCVDDIIRCTCGEFEEQGFMIQCEQCLTWQHGDCVQLTIESVPKKYICYQCNNPKGLRKSFKYKNNYDWYKRGILPSVIQHVDGSEEKLANISQASHALMEDISNVMDVLQGIKHKLALLDSPLDSPLRFWKRKLVKPLTNEAKHCAENATGAGNDRHVSITNRTSDNVERVEGASFGRNQSDDGPDLVGPKNKPDNGIENRPSLSKCGSDGNFCDAGNGPIEKLKSESDSTSNSTVDAEKLELNMTKVNLLDHVENIEDELASRMDEIEKNLDLLETEYKKIGDDCCDNWPKSGFKMVIPDITSIAKHIRYINTQLMDAK